MARGISEDKTTRSKSKSTFTILILWVSGSPHWLTLYWTWRFSHLWQTRICHEWEQHAVPSLFMPPPGLARSSFWDWWWWGGWYTLLSYWRALEFRDSSQTVTVYVFCFKELKEPTLNFFLLWWSLILHVLLGLSPVFSFLTLMEWVSHRCNELFWTLVCSYPYLNIFFYIVRRVVGVLPMNLFQGFDFSLSLLDSMYYKFLYLNILSALLRYLMISSYVTILLECSTWVYIMFLNVPCVKKWDLLPWPVMQSLHEWRDTPVTSLQPNCRALLIKVPIKMTRLDGIIDHVINYPVPLSKLPVGQESWPF